MEDDSNRNGSDGDPVLPSIEIISQSNIFQMINADSQTTFSDFSSLTSINSSQLITQTHTENTNHDAVYLPVKIQFCDNLNGSLSAENSAYTDVVSASAINLHDSVVFSENNTLLSIPSSTSCQSSRNQPVTKDVQLSFATEYAPSCDDKPQFMEENTDKESGPKYVYVSTHEEIEEAIRKHGEETFSHFVVSKKTKGYGSAAPAINISNKFRIHWQSRDLSSTEECAVQIAFDGVPFIYIGEKTYMCHLGRYRTSQVKNDSENGDIDDTKKIHRSKMSKKQGCLAKIFVKQIAKFPQFRIRANTEYLRNQASQKMRKALLANDGEIDHVIQYIATLPHVSEHSNHDIGKDVIVKEPIDSLIRDKILELSWQYGENATARNIQELLTDYVENVLFKGKSPPSRSRRRFFPSEKDIGNYISKSKSVGKLSPNEKDKLEKLLKSSSDKETDSKISYLIEVPNEDECKSGMITNSVQKFYFSYQTENQQRLLRKYGGQVILTELSKQTINLPFPFFGMFVPTNVDYQLVFTFLVQTRSKEHIKQAMLPLLSWNPNWKPRFLVVDFSREQIVAAEELFPGTVVLISDVSREQSWKIWLNNPVNLSNLCGDKDQVYGYLDALANSYTEDALNSAADVLEKSDVWKLSDGLREWFSANWLSEAKRWVVGYRHEEFVPTIHLPHTLSEEKEAMRDLHLVYLKQKRLCEFIEVLLMKTTPESFVRYIERNVQDRDSLSMLLKTNANLPSFLWHCSYTVACHIVEQMENSIMKEYRVNRVQPGVFWVQNKSEEHLTHIVSFGDSHSLPSCVCLDWLKYRLPCVHMIAIFSVTSWSWGMLSVLYTSNPIYNNESCFVDSEKRDSHLKRSCIEDRSSNEKLVDGESIALRLQCGKICDEIKEACSKINDKSSLQKVKINLQVALNDIKVSPCQVDKSTGGKLSGASYALKSGTEFRSINNLLANIKPDSHNGKRTSLIKQIIVKEKRPRKTKDDIDKTSPSKDNWIYDKDLKISLSAEEKEIISNGSPLTENILSNIQQILLHQFKDTYTLEHIKSVEDFVEDTWFNMKFFHFHKTKKDHIAISFKQSKSKSLNIFYCKHFSKDIFSQELCPLFEKISITDEDIMYHIQDNDHCIDCSIFSVVYATHTAFNIPVNTYGDFNRSKLRTHLIECLEDMCFSMFPVTK